MVRDDQVEPQLARPDGRFGGADAAVDRDDQTHAAGVQPLDRFRLEAVAVAQPVRHEVLDPRAEELERASQDGGRRDAVDVVVAVDGDPLVARDGAEEAVDRFAHAGQLKGIVKMLQARRQEPARRLRVVETTLAQQARDDRRHPQRPRRLDHEGVVGPDVFPDAALHQPGRPLPRASAPARPSDAWFSSTNAWPSRPITRNFW